MADDDMPVPSRPKPAVAQYTHKTYAFRRISKKYGRYLECGVARAPACAHCGTPFTGYTILQADSLDAAARLAKNSPVLQGGGSVTVYEAFDVM